jgi:hypothetical protein
VGAHPGRRLGVKQMKLFLTQKQLRGPAHAFAHKSIFKKITRRDKTGLYSWVDARATYESRLQEYLVVPVPP